MVKFNSSYNITKLCNQPKNFLMLVEALKNIMDYKKTLTAYDCRFEAFKVLKEVGVIKEKK